jgi:hypothetical protein
VSSQLRDPCGLLAPEDIHSVQGVSVKERKRSENENRTLHFQQCLFATADFARSISLTLITEKSTQTKTNATRAYWEDTFHRPQNGSPAQASNRKKNPPRSIAGIGEEAFWTGDAKAGTLYVKENGVVLRLSVGGVPDEEERIRRSKSLAQAALRRLVTPHRE